MDRKELAEALNRQCERAAIAASAGTISCKLGTAR
jgi:hypothetical protein